MPSRIASRKPFARKGVMQPPVPAATYRPALQASTVPLDGRINRIGGHPSRWRATYQEGYARNAHHSQRIHAD